MSEIRVHRFRRGHRAGGCGGVERVVGCKLDFFILLGQRIGAFLRRHDRHHGDGRGQLECVGRPLISASEQVYRSGVPLRE